MRRDYRLYELNADEFERLTAQICVKWLGEGVIPFAPGRDGGRDAKFCGSAERFPSTAAPLKGHCVIQAKHVAAADKSCSDREFGQVLRKEYPKIVRLIKANICQHYIIFTNRKLTGGADEMHIAALVKLGLETAHIVAVERIHQALDEHQDLRAGLPNLRDATPFRFAPDDLIEVIRALHDYVGTGLDGFNGARNFESIRIRDEKNRINGLSLEYYDQIIVNNSMPYFASVEQFLKNPRNREFRDLYHDTADELRQKILAQRDMFASFDDVFAFMYEQIQGQRAALKGRRRLVSIMLHYMYFNCDIGSKEPHAEAVVYAGT